MVRAVETNEREPSVVSDSTVALDRLPPTLSTREAAAILGRSVATIERYAADGILPTLRRRGTGAPWRIVTVRLLVEHLGYSDEQVLSLVRFPLATNVAPTRSAFTLTPERLPSRDR
jgi:hypothetical protein